MKKAGDLVNVFFTEVQKKQGNQYNTFHNSWKDIAGDKIGNNTEIKDVIDGNLIIEIDHPGWKQLIMIKEKQIIRKINKEFSELSVKKIKYYFKNNSGNVSNRELNPKKIKENTINVDIKQDDVEIENKDFSELLKKMSKRSQELT